MKMSWIDPPFVFSKHITLVFGNCSEKVLHQLRTESHFLNVILPEIFFWSFKKNCSHDERITCKKPSSRRSSILRNISPWIIKTIRVITVSTEWITFHWYVIEVWYDSWMLSNDMNKYLSYFWIWNLIFYKKTFEDTKYIDTKWMIILYRWQYISVQIQKNNIRNHVQMSCHINEYFIKVSMYLSCLALCLTLNILKTW